MATFNEMVDVEISNARAKHPTPINSSHEAYSVILEELTEFWDEVRKQIEDRDPERMGDELVQVAAMARRAFEDLGFFKL